MKLIGFLLPALAGVAAADSAPSHAEAYMLRHTKQTTTSEPASIPKPLAEAVLLQRLSSPNQPSTLGQIPPSLDEDEAISYVNAFGKPPHPLFSSSDVDEAKQLVIAFSATNPDHYKQLRAAIPRVPLAFTAPGLGRLPAKVTTDCPFAQAVHPKGKEASKCWNGNTQYLQYDASSDKEIIKQLGVNLATLKSYANKGVMETTIVLLDTSAPGEAEPHHKRDGLFQNEKIMTDSSTREEEEPKFPFFESTHGSAKVLDRPGVVPSCFDSKDACEDATNSCSGHGLCVNKWARDSTDKTCFFCQCKKTVTNTTVQNWGGAMCQKRDVSTPFWLFASVTITLVATVAFSIGLLFSVGEQKLPGVIGAGVSRSK